jgi:methanogenic corrinoid protein MtbC1
MTPDTTDTAAVADALLLDLDRLICARDRIGAIARARAAVLGDALTIPQLYALVLSPLMTLIGTRWQQGEEEVWEEHYTTAACPAEEYHDLGLRMLADRLALLGYRAHFLGATVPQVELVHAVKELGADTVLLSASTHLNRVQLRCYVDELVAAVPGLIVWVGGPAFAHGHADWSDAEVPDLAAILDDLGEA